MEDLGEEGLQAAGDKIALALKSQHLPPNEVLRSFPVPDVDSITYKSFDYYNQTGENQPEGFELKSIPFPFHLNDMKSQFVRLHFLMDTSKLPPEDAPYLVLLTELWLQSPLRHPDTGKLESLQELIARRSRDVVSLKNSLGHDGSKFDPGSFSHLLFFHLEAVTEKYSEAIGILKETLFNVEFTEERIRSIISQLLNGIPGEKLSGPTVVRSLLDNIYYNEKNNVHYSSFLRQQKFLNYSLGLLKDNPAKLIQKLISIKDQLVRPNNCITFMSVELQRLRRIFGDHGADIWREFFHTTSHPNSILKRHVLNEFNVIPEYLNRDHSPKLRHAIIGLAGISFNLNTSPHLMAPEELLRSLSRRDKAETPRSINFTTHWHWCLSHISIALGSSSWFSPYQTKSQFHLLHV